MVTTILCSFWVCVDTTTTISCSFCVHHHLLLLEEHLLLLLPPGTTARAPPPAEPIHPNDEEEEEEDPLPTLEEVARRTNTIYQELPGETPQPWEYSLLPHIPQAVLMATSIPSIQQ